MQLTRATTRLSVLGLALVVVTSASTTDARPLDGQEIFRYDTFGDEQLWTDVLRMHEALQSVSPVVALGVGLKVDADALPPEVIGALGAGTVDLDGPSVRLTPLGLGAVVGVQGKVEAGQLTSVGVTCALCHSTEDDSLAPGIGKRLDGWPNRDLDVGATLGLSPALDDALKAELATWGPGKSRVPRCLRMTTC